MKKTLIALTLAALPVASMAEVVLYGKISGGVEVTKDKGMDGTTTKIVDYGSRIGFKGQEQINNGLKAIWQVDQRVNIGGQNTGFSTRDAFIGLDGGFGTVKVGHLGSPNHQQNGDLDWWSYSDNSGGLGVFTRGNDVVKRRVAVRYETPDIAGFQATAYASPSNNNILGAEAEHVRRSKDSSVYGVGLGYKNSGFFAKAAGTYVKNGLNNVATRSNGTKAAHAYQLIGQTGYENDNMLFGVAYQHSKNVDNYQNLTGLSILVDPTTQQVYNASDVKITNVQEVAATVSVPVSNALTLKGSAGYGFKMKYADDKNGETSLDNGKYLQGVVGADYHLSKRTMLNGQVGYLQFGKKGNIFGKGTVGVGMTHRF